MKIQELFLQRIKEKLGKTPEQVESEIRSSLQPFKSAREPIHPIPRKDWPVWVKALAQFATPNDKGIGDVVRRMIGEENSEAFKKWFKTTTGKDCGCTGRQRRWNIEYPL